MVVAGTAAVLAAACQPAVGAPSPEPTRTIAPTTTVAPTTVSTGKPPVTTTKPSSTSSSKPSTTRPTSAPAPGALPSGVVPAPGQVGFRGDPATLKVVDGPGNAPAGTTWSAGVLRVSGKDVVLDKVFVKGGVEYNGTGTLAIRGSIVEGNRNSWAAVLGNSGHLDIRDTTVRWKAGDGGPNNKWGNGAIHGDSTMTVIRCDISGTPDGVQNGRGNSTFEQNHIHDLARFGSYPNNTHNDGIQNYGGANLVIKYNRIDIEGPDGVAYDGTHQNAALFFMPSGGNPSANLQVVGNFLAGGGYILRLGAPMSGAVVADNRFGPTTGGWGEVTKDGGASLKQWANNLDNEGQPVRQP
ncbi:hypothetical protein EV193_103219 [Herbihabitans rhizosphaerae]|uniref:Parallel beta helix pectate lyase-like protein n=2 Tax=Herbihabitans rhizosphaerae TaxID=1872711 RepID=A0A4Q7KVZ3_9PSEU|nr:hypothetical protein EV193_103219 [Herbihabitans rhizosphaerae]